MIREDSDTDSSSEGSYTNFAGKEEWANDVGEFTGNDLGFRTFLRLQFEVQFRFVVLAGVYLSVVCTLMDAALVLGVESSIQIPRDYKGSLLSKYYFILRSQDMYRMFH